VFSSSSRPRHSKNEFLNSLPVEDFASIEPFLETVYLEQGAELINFGSKVTHVYFPQSGLISLVVRLDTGKMVEVAMVGRSGVFGASARSIWPSRVTTAVVQLTGYATTLSVSRLRMLAAKNAAFRTALIKYKQSLFIEIQQTVACLASHTSDARIATWLLRARDISGDSSLPLTREFLSEMLGLHRNAVSAVAQSLQNAGLIKYSRGRVDVVDSEGLKHAACECYAKVQAVSRGLAVAETLEANFAPAL